MRWQGRRQSSNVEDRRRGGLGSILQTPVHRIENPDFCQFFVNSRDEKNTSLRW